MPFETVFVGPARGLSNPKQPERFDAAVLEFLLRYHGAPDVKEDA